MKKEFHSPLHMHTHTHTQKNENFNFIVKICRVHQFLVPAVQRTLFVYLETHTP